MRPLVSLGIQNLKICPIPERIRLRHKVEKVKEKEYVSDFQIDTDLEIMFPDEYVSNISERIRLYKEFNEIDTEESLDLFEKKLTDRFGPLPPPAVALLDIVRIKWLAVKLGIEKILLKNNLLIANFVSDPQFRILQKLTFCLDNELCKPSPETDVSEAEGVQAKPDNYKCHFCKIGY